MPTRSPTGREVRTLDTMQDYTELCICTNVGAARTSQLVGEQLVDPGHLGLQLAGVAGADVGLDHERDARVGRGHGVDALLEHRHHLVPLALDVGEHRVGLVRQPRGAHDAHRLGDGGGVRPGVVRAGWGDAERDDHVVESRDTPLARRPGGVFSTLDGAGSAVAALVARGAGRDVGQPVARGRPRGAPTRSTSPPSASDCSARTAIDGPSMWKKRRAAGAGVGEAEAVGAERGEVAAAPTGGSGPGRPACSRTPPRPGPGAGQLLGHVRHAAASVSGCRKACLVGSAARRGAARSTTSPTTRRPRRPSRRAAAPGPRAPTARRRRRPAAAPAGVVGQALGGPAASAGRCPRRMPSTSTSSGSAGCTIGSL